VFILIKSIRSKETNFTNPDFIHTQERDLYRIQSLLVLSILLLVSGVLTLILHLKFFVQLHYLLKIPVYAVLGVSVNFALTVSALDIINMAFLLVQKPDSKPPINSGAQIISIVIICCIMGLLFGLIFGIMDIEDVSNRFIRQELLKEENYCLPIGLILGAIAGILTAATDKVNNIHYARNRSIHRIPVSGL
jgi:FtsH-binding integral membrane protein